MSIPRDTIELIRERAQIHEIVKRYVPSLQKKGRNYVGLCPFHKETSPSFTVSADKQIFYCFGCHTGGNVFSFISKVERLNFPESVRFIGGLVGIQVKEETGGGREDNTELEALKKLNRIAMTHYHSTMRSPEGKAGLDYITGRGVRDESINEFKLGYAPEEWEYLARHLARARAPLPLAVRAGLLAQNEKTGNFYDRFRKRIIFPIFSQKNEIIAFGGRLIDSGEPKYLNSPESEIFKKGSVLYGLNMAREHITSLNRAILVEGYLDVIGCHQAGIKNVVAPLGTALTVNQLRLLSRLCGEVVLLFDADSAGIKASLRSLELLREVNIQARVAVLPEGDPFDYILKKDIREFMAVVDSAIKPVDFMIQSVLAGSAGKSQVDILVALFEIVRGIEFETERSRYLRQISGFLKVTEADVRADFGKFLQNRLRTEKAPSPRMPQPGARVKEDYPVRTYRELVLLLCSYPELMDKAIIDFSDMDNPDPVSAAIFRKMADLFSDDRKISIDRLFDFFPDGPERRFLEENLVRDYNTLNPGAIYTEIYINLKLYMIDQKIEWLAGQIKNAGPAADGDVREHMIELEILRREREKLSSYNYNKTKFN